MVKNLTAVVCGNGMGHLRRVIAVLSALYEQSGNIETFLLAPNIFLEKLTSWPLWQKLKRQPRLEIIEFDSGRPLEIASKSKIDMYDCLRPYQNYFNTNIVWSDNLLEILTFRQDAILSGSFFWHEVLLHELGDKPDIKAYAEGARKLLLKCQPIMIGQENLATEEVKRLTRFYGVGFYRYDAQKMVRNKNDILISCGLSGACRDQVRDAIMDILDQNESLPTTIWVEPSMLPLNVPPLMNSATFDSDMFARIGAACVRPGIGTISDVLVNGGRIFAFHEGSFEMIHNTEALVRMGVGQVADNATKAFEQALEYLDDPLARKQHKIALRTIKDDGVKATAKLIGQFL